MRVWHTCGIPLAASYNGHDEEGWNWDIACFACPEDRIAFILALQEAAPKIGYIVEIRSIDDPRVLPDMYKGQVRRDIEWDRDFYTVQYTLSKQETQQ